MIGPTLAVLKSLLQKSKTPFVFMLVGFGLAFAGILAFQFAGFILGGAVLIVSIMIRFKAEASRFVPKDRGGSARD